MTVTRRKWMLAAVVLFACSDSPMGPVAADFPDEPAPDPHPEVVAFVDVNVIPDGTRAIAGQTVVVRGGTIETVGAADAVTVPDGAFVIEGRGRFLTAGLVDMHVHATSGSVAGLRNDFLLYLANGVTTARVMWGGSRILGERGRIDSGEVLGPTLLVASPGVDGPGGVWTGSTPPVAGPAEGRERVADHAAAGYDFVKVYNDLDPATYDAIVDEAATRGIPVVGHVPSRVGIERVQDAGQLTSEHLIGFRIAARTANGIDLARVRSLAARSSARGVWHTPTITVDALSRDRVAEIRLSDELRRVSPGMRDFFETGFFHGLAPAAAARERAEHEAMIAAIRESGAGLLVGTDAGFGWILPGYAMHDEIDGLSRAGLPNSVVLSAATADAARSVGRSADFGSVVVGARADLLLLASSPLDDLAALRESSGVMVRGRWLSRLTLAAMVDALGPI